VERWHMGNRSVLILAIAIQSLLTGQIWAEKRPAAARAHARTVDDFEDGDRRAPAGLSWISVADDLMGGS
jgi:hypothetical protein